MPVETPLDWEAALHRIARGPSRRVLVLGAPDAGKSTFCGLLLAQAAGLSRPAALLDTDPGQKQLGPPACVTLGRIAGSGPPILSALAYLGAIEPLGAWARLMESSAALAAEARAGLLVINTCGLLRGPGRRLKLALIAALRPDLLVAIGEDRDLGAVLADHAALPSLALARPPLARRKGAGERRALRRAGFRDYLEGAPAWPLAIAGLSLHSDTGEAGPPPGRLLALANEAGADMALGRVIRHDHQGFLHLRAPRPDRPVAGLRWTRLSLDEGWAEYRAPLASRPA
ncbi:Clp1/GlmU family protein [Roseomonas sp. GCM10028921]